MRENEHKTTKSMAIGIFKIRISLGILILVTGTISMFAGLFDTVLDSKETKEGKKNDAWYESNKDSLHVKLDALGYNTNSSTITLKGVIENLSEEKSPLSSWTSS
jgi:hypothetical protein